MVRRVVVFTLLALNTCYPQNYNWTIALLGGGSVPLGNYSNANDNNQRAGFATTGPCFDLTIKYKLVNRIGLIFNGHLQSNPVNEKSLADQFSAQQPNTEWSVNSSSYKSIGILTGIFVSLPMDISEKIEIGFDFLIGILKSKSPEATITNNISGTTSAMTGKSKTNGEPAFSVGSGIKYNYSRNISFIGDIKYLYTDPMFQIEIANGNSSEFNPTNRVIETLNLSFGIGFGF